MSFHLETFTAAVSDAGERVTVPAREQLRYEGRGLVCDMPFGAGGPGGATLYRDELERLPADQRAPVRQAIDEAVALIYEGNYRWS